MPVQRGQPHLEQHLGRTNGPLPLMFHGFKPFQEAADIDQNAVQFRPDCFQCPLNADTAGQRDIGEISHAPDPLRPLPTFVSQRMVTDGMSDPRVKSARSLSPARNSLSEIKEEPFAFLRL